MFRSDRGDGARVTATSAGGKRGLFSVLGADVTVTGNIAATADLHLEGRVDGDVACTMLVQGADSIVTGAVKAESARIAGTINGTVSVAQLTIEASAVITGDVDYQSVSIDKGARIDGRLRHRDGVPVVEVLALTASEAA